MYVIAIVFAALIGTGRNLPIIQKILNCFLLLFYSLLIEAIRHAASISKLSVLNNVKLNLAITLRIKENTKYQGLNESTGNKW